MSCRSVAFGLQAEILKKQDADLAARKQAQAAAAAAEAARRAAQPAPKAFNEAGDLIHLTGGRAELDDILRQTGPPLAVPPQ